MIFSFWSWLPGFPQWLTFETNLLEGFLQGLVGACGISVLNSLLRVHLYLKSVRCDSVGGEKETRQQWIGAKGRLSETLQFWFLVGVLLLVGSRVASLVVLEYILRAALARVTVGPDLRPITTLEFLTQCQFSLGCALTCSLHFLQEGAPQRTFSLLLAVGLSWLLVNLSARMWRHVAVLYRLHSSQRYCGLCIGLLTSGHAVMTVLCRAVVLTFTVGAIAGLSTINHYFLSTAEALRFWTPLTICYTLLVVYMQDDERRRPGTDAQLQAVGVRLGALLVLMLTVGRWVDVFHILLCFLGEAGCLLMNWDLLDVTVRDVGEENSCQPSADLTEKHKRHTEAITVAKKHKNL